MDVVLVDNASSDGSVDYVRSNFPWVKVIENKVNSGFAEGNNVALSAASGDYLVFLNCDTEVDSQWLDFLVQGVESSENVAICGSKVLDLKQPNIIQEVGGLCDKFGFSLSRGWGEVDCRQYSEMVDTFYVSGASLLIKKEIVDKIGLFDSKYFFNQEDVDLCWRAHLAGYRVIVNPSSVVYHKGGGAAQWSPGDNVGKERGDYVTTSWRRYFAERNILRTIIKNYNFFSLVSVLPVFLFMYTLETGLYVLTGKFNVAKAYVNALLWNMQNLKDTWSNHEKVQQFRAVSDYEIQTKMIRGIGKIIRFKQVGTPRFK